MVVMVIAPVVSMPACRLLAANAVLSWLRVETWPAPVPKVMLVAVPLPVAAIVSVLPVIAGGVTFVVPAARPSAASALPVPPAMTRSCAVPVLRMSWPEPLTVEAVVAPVIPSIALRTVCTVAVLPAPVPIVTLPLLSVVVVVCPVLKVMFLPSTVRTDPLVMAVARSLEVPLAVPTSWVAAVISTDVVLSFLMVVPGTVVALVPGPNRLFAVAPGMAVAVTLDFVE